MAENRFWIVDSCLVDFVGHHFEYDHALAHEAQLRGYDVRVLTHGSVNSDIRTRLKCTPVFRDTIWQTQRLWSLLSHECGVWSANRRYLSDLLRGLSRSELNEDSVVFAHMITSRQLLAWAWWCDLMPPENCPRIVLLLRYQKEFYDDPICRRAFRTLERAARSRPIRLATDSARLADDYSSLTSLPFEVLAIPHTCNASHVAPTPQSTPEPLRVVSLGNARDEKGFFEIMRAADLLRPELEAGRLELVLQCNNPWPDQLATEIEQWADSLPQGVTLIRKPLDTEAYYELLNDSDIVLLPYWRSIYASRTSGVFVEALAAGKPVVASSETWMSDCLGEYGAGTTCCERDPRSLVEAIRRVADDIEHYSRAARTASARWLKFHSAATLVDQLIRAKPRAGRRAAVLYPWGNLIERDSGAAVRTGLLVDFMKTQFDEMRVLQTNSIATPPDDGVVWESYEPKRLDSSLEGIAHRFDRSIPPFHTMRNRLASAIARRARRISIQRIRSAVARRTGLTQRRRARLRRLIPAAIRRPIGFVAGVTISGIMSVTVAAYQFLAAGVNKGPRSVFLCGKTLYKQMLPPFIKRRRAARFMLLQHSQYRHDAEFAFRMRELAEWADVIFLDYTFWGSILAPRCRKTGAKLVISDLDVVADQSKAYPNIHRRTLAVELKALAECDHAVCVSASDRATFAAHGVQTTLISNPIDIDSCTSRLDDRTVRATLHRLLGEDTEQSICLFVGSSHVPNIEAAVKIAEMAASPESRDIVFVIAGGCTAPGREGNLHRLGRISADELTVLYQAARVVLNPVLSGTGTAVKTLEAMGRGKVLVATSIGVRGLPIESGVHGIVCDDLASYPKLLAELLQNRDRCRRLAAEASSFAADYDYRVVYQTYMQLLNSTDGRAVRQLEHVAA